MHNGMQPKRDSPLKFYPQSPTHPPNHLAHLLIRFGSTGGVKASGEGEAKAIGVVAEPKSKDSPQQQRTTQAVTAPSVLISVQEAVRRVRNGGDGADFLVVEWRQGGTTSTGAGQQEQLEIKEVTGESRVCEGAGVPSFGGWVTVLRWVYSGSVPRSRKGEHGGSSTCTCCVCTMSGLQHSSVPLPRPPSWRAFPSPGYYTR